MASRDREETASSTGWVFFDRSLVDAVVALRHATGASIPLEPYERYHSKVFLAPPWPDIYVADRERPYDLDGAIAEYDRLFASYGDLRLRNDPSAEGQCCRASGFRSASPALTG